MKPSTTSIFTFADLIDGGHIYVDKTARLYDLVRSYKGVYFLSRPRRFGKSLTISTREPVFQGRRELFLGLAVLLPNTLKWYKIRHGQLQPIPLRSAA